MRENSNAWAEAVVVIVVLGALFAGGWWIENRFGPSGVLMLLGALFGILCWAGGNMMNQRNTKAVLRSVADFNHDLSGTLKEAMRGHNMQSKIEVLDAQRVERLSQQRASLLLDVERQRMQLEQKPAQDWDDSDVVYEEVG